jgi:hypothetical protein
VSNFFWIAKTLMAPIVVLNIGIGIAIFFCCRVESAPLPPGHLAPYKFGFITQYIPEFATGGTLPFGSQPDLISQQVEFDSAGGDQTQPESQVDADQAGHDGRYYVVHTSALQLYVTLLGLLLGLWSIEVLYGRFERRTDREYFVNKALTLHVEEAIRDRLPEKMIEEHVLLVMSVRFPEFRPQYPFGGDPKYKAAKRSRK